MKETPEDIISQIALLEMTHVGPRIARKLINYFGSAHEVINASIQELRELGAIGEKILEQRSNEEHVNFAKAQVQYCAQQGAQIISYYGKQFPYRLKQCADAPLVLYQRGFCDLNTEKFVAIVGTRNCSTHGKEICGKLVEKLADYNVKIVSGLAYGIDACAHQNAIQNNLYNIGVVAHGLDRMYPNDHISLAKKVIQKGAIVTEFPTKTNPDRENFPKRNRIVAGMADAIIVVESAIKGGSMITAKLGNDYSRDVFAVPGRIGDDRSRGCNHLIKSNQAHLLESVDDMAYVLGWQESNTTQKHTQQKMVFDLSETEKKITTALNQNPLNIDEIAKRVNMSVAHLSSQLLMLELRGIIKQLPGKKYQMT